MNDAKYIGLDVHQATISVAVRDSAGKLVIEAILETKAETILQFLRGLRGSLHVTFEEGTWAAWLHDLLQPHVTRVLVCDPRKNALLKAGNKNDRIDARKLSDLLYLNKLSAVYHGEQGIRTLKELAADAAANAAKASVDQALAAQENLRLLKESYEARTGEGPQIVLEAIRRAKSLIVYWKTEAARIAQPPQGNPDPEPLAHSGLLAVLGHARQIPGCAGSLIDADAAMANAKSELEKAYAAASKQTFLATSGRAPEYLKQADELLDQASNLALQAIVPQTRS